MPFDFSALSISDLVSVQPMSEPSGTVFYADMVSRPRRLPRKLKKVRGRARTLRLGRRIKYPCFEKWIFPVFRRPVLLWKDLPSEDSD